MLSFERNMSVVQFAHSNDWMHADYCFGDVKFGGNAQAITKQRFLHHTSLLWDYQSERMRLLKHPSKIPDYRAVIPLNMQNTHAMYLTIAKQDSMPQDR